jgi:HlyD family secretion protein
MDQRAKLLLSPISAGRGFTRTEICATIDIRKIEVEVDVNEAFVDRVHAGSAVEGTLDAYPEWTIPGSVIAIVPIANWEKAKATVRVRIGAKKSDRRILRHGHQGCVRK